MTEKQWRTLLIVASDPGERRLLAAALSDCEGLSIAPIEPAQLCETARWIDAVGAVVALSAADDARAVEGLERLAGMQAGQAIVLVVGRVADESLEHWLHRLRPAHLISGPPNRAALRWAVDALDLAARGGEGARRKHRRAPALLGVSTAIREVITRIQQVAPSRATVLILGETGTGKELAARAIHEQSGRRGAFVAVNCGALPESLLESELFGYARGAFTGASHTKRGLFEEAHGGTLFLDEIGDMPAALQVSLLRVLESGEIRPVGATQSRTVDVRVVSATHRDIESLVQEGTFRADLLYRINTFTLHVPPLRRRAVDIPFLAQHFAEELGAQQARKITLDESFLAALSLETFPGNVRELRNAVERAIALAAPGDPVTAAAPDRAARSIPLAGTLQQRVEAVEMQAIREALARVHGNRSRAAELLGLSRVGLRAKMRRLGIDADER
jgi:DNA-binding NtrC family response regulator